MKALFALTNLLLLASAAWLAAGLVYPDAAEDPAQQNELMERGQQSASGRSPSAKPLKVYDVITERNLFNTASPPEKTETGKVLDIAAMEQTTLDLRLWGTVVTSRGRGDYAIIEDKKRRKQELYRTGDPLQNAVVKAVLREKVVLNVGGKDEILAMEEATGAPAAPAGRRAAPRRPPIERNLPVDRSAVSEAMENIGDLMKTVRIRPHFEKGQPAGLRLAGVRPNSVVRKLGLRSGDILQAVDGAPVRSVDDVVNLYSKLTSQDDLTLQIKRRGRVQNLRFQMK